MEHQPPTLSEATKTWARIGVLSFGGPTAQIALMHKVTVDEKKWLTENQYLSALSFCMLLPGPEAMQLATYTGWRLNGVIGGLIAGLLFVLPGAAVVLALAAIYASFGTVPMVEAIFLGIKAAVLIIVIEALKKISGRALKRRHHWVIAILSFIAIFFLSIPFPIIIITAALWGYFFGRETATAEEQAASAISVTPLQTAKTAIIWLTIWLAPLLALAAYVGPDHVLTNIGLFFSKLAIVSFGGAYALLAYMAQDVVSHFGWLQPGQMMDGLGLAETTPGPLILVTEFVGFLAAYQATPSPHWSYGLAGAVVALWATFAPCFLWIFVGAPYIEWITSRPALKAALSAITAAVVGVILNLALWFALHVFFANVDRTDLGPVNLWLPELSTLDWRVILLATISGILLLRVKLPILWVLAVSAAVALTLNYAL